MQNLDISPEEASALYENLSEIMEMQHLYRSAIRGMQTRLETINDEFKVFHARNPIHHIESRLKTNESIINKLRRRGLELSIRSAKENLNDIAGIRVVCYYIDDVYDIEKILLRQSDIKLLKRQDYIKEPNFNGYRSLHLDLSVPVFLSDRTEYVMVEVQIRTVAMDLWGSLEHDLRYKQDKVIPEKINDDMIRIGDAIANIDVELQEIYKQIQKI